jgi:hypothetical protein
VSKENGQNRKLFKPAPEVSKDESNEKSRRRRREEEERRGRTSDIERFLPVHSKRNNLGGV